MSSAVKACPDPCNKGCEDDATLKLTGIINHRSCTIVDGLPSRHDVTCDIRFGGSLNVHQETFCGRGEWELKKVVSCVFKACEQISAITIAPPSMLIGMREEAPDLCILRPSTLNRQAAAMDFDVHSFAAQLTADTLSQNMPMCFLLMLP
eukprot:1274114-Ditylum_brightwellii.AAC.1